MIRELVFLIFIMMFITHPVYADDNIGAYDTFKRLEETLGESGWPVNENGVAVSPSDSVRIPVQVEIGNGNTKITYDSSKEATIIQTGGSRKPPSTSGRTVQAAT